MLAKYTCFTLCYVQMANSLMHQVQQLKLLIDQARQQSENDHDSVFEMLRAQFEKEKTEASLLHCYRSLLFVRNYL